MGEGLSEVTGWAGPRGHGGPISGGTATSAVAGTPAALWVGVAKSSRFPREAGDLEVYIQTPHYGSVDNQLKGSETTVGKPVCGQIRLMAASPSPQPRRASLHEHFGV